MAETRIDTPSPDALVRAVLYDIDGTLYHLGRMRRRMAGELARSALRSPLRTMRHWRVIQAYRQAQEQLRGGDAGVSQLEAAAEKLGVPSDEVRAVIEEWMERRPLAVLGGCRREPVIGAIRLLAKCGIPQAAFSDYPAESKVEIFGVARHFEFRLSSSDPDVGAFKPSPRGFLHAASRWGLPPSEIVYVGDREEVDGAGARAAGMRFVHVGKITARRLLKAEQAGAEHACRHLFEL